MADRKRKRDLEKRIDDTSGSEAQVENAQLARMLD